MSHDDNFSFSAAASDPPVENNMAGEEIETAASTAEQPSAKQCIFFPVKEEERELLLDPLQRVESKSIHMIIQMLECYFKV